MEEFEQVTAEAERPWEVLAQLIEAGDSEHLQSFLDAMASGDQARAISRLGVEQQRFLLTVLPPDEAAELVTRLSDAQAIELIDRLGPSEAAAIVHELPSNEQADLLGDLDDEDAEAILSRMDPSEAAALRSLTEYEDDVAGGLMVTELLRFLDSMTIGDVASDLTSHAEAYRNYDVQYAYITDAHDRLVGVLRMRDLLLAPGTCRFPRS